MANAVAEKPKHETVMDVTGDEVARGYAVAFWNVAAKSSNAGSLVEELSSFTTDVLDKYPALDESLRSAIVRHEQKAAMLDRLFSQRLSVELLTFLKVMSRHGRLGLVRSAARIVRKLYAEQQGMTDVDVVVASPLADNLKNEIQAKLRATLGREPVLHVKVDPSLIAGIVIRVGDRVYDSSVNTQFNLARKAMIERAVDLIETQPEKFLQLTS
jgi:F-type H+-transporting ATPase subunit delta